MQDSYVTERDRSRIPEKYKWDISDVYTDDDAWKTAKNALVAALPEIADFAGKLADAPGNINGIFTNADFPYPPCMTAALISEADIPPGCIAFINAATLVTKGAAKEVPCQIA